MLYRVSRPFFCQDQEGLKGVVMPMPSQVSSSSTLMIGSWYSGNFPISEWEVEAGLLLLAATFEWSVEAGWWS